MDKEGETAMTRCHGWGGREPLASIGDTWIQAVQSTHLYKVGLWVPEAWPVSADGDHDNCGKLDKVTEIEMS